MSVSLEPARAALASYFRSPSQLIQFATGAHRSQAEGFFRFEGAVCFGTAQGAVPSGHIADDLHEITYHLSADGTPVLPFDLAEVADNLRQERYRQNGYAFLNRASSGAAAEQLYYLLRPMLPVNVRRHLQKLRLSGWQDIPFPSWPVDVSVEQLMRGTVRVLLQSSGRKRLPFIWFWPDGLPTCTMVTHDVEGEAGLSFSNTVMDVDQDHGVPSAFQLIPEGQGSSWRDVAAAIRARGFEVNLHDLNHDGRLYQSREQFLERAQRINAYARDIGCRGFRSGAMYRQQGWYDAFDFAYDMSVPNAAHLEPQRGGCCTVMPYFVGKILELPLTTAQDYSLFFILGDYSTALWQQQIARIEAENGLISVITHPDYLVGTKEMAVYRQLLQLLASLRDEGRTWMALPDQIDRWWRARQEMSLVPNGDGWRVVGPESERACVAYATLDGDDVVYTVERAG